MKDIPQSIKKTLSQYPTIEYVGEYKGQSVWHGFDFASAKGSTVVLAKNNAITKKIFVGTSWPGLYLDKPILELIERAHN